jgi:hypothetical protein
MIERMFFSDSPRVGDASPCSRVLVAGRVAHDAELGLAREVASWLAVEGWKVDGARSAPAWLTWKLKVSYSRATGLLRLGQALLAEPLIAAALDGHRLSLDQAEPIIAAGTPEREREYRRDLETMIDEASRLSVSQVRALTAHWANLADQTRQQADDAPPAPEPKSKLHVVAW